MAFANLQDVQTRLGRLISEAPEIDQVNAWISDVEVTIQSRIEDLPDRVAIDPVYEALVKKIIAQIVCRKIKNPDGKQNERIDDYREAYATSGEGIEQVTPMDLPERTRRALRKRFGGAVAVVNSL